jgi:hypothetical protein
MADVNWGEYIDAFRRAYKGTRTERELAARELGSFISRQSARYRQAGLSAPDSDERLRSELGEAEKLAERLVRSRRVHLLQYGLSMALWTGAAFVPEFMRMFVLHPVQNTVWGIVVHQLVLLLAVVIAFTVGERAGGHFRASPALRGFEIGLLGSIPAYVLGGIGAFVAFRAGAPALELAQAFFYLVYQPIILGLTAGLGVTVTARKKR